MFYLNRLDLSEISLISLPLTYVISIGCCCQKLVWYPYHKYISNLNSFFDATDGFDIFIITYLNSSVLSETGLTSLSYLNIIVMWQMSVISLSAPYFTLTRWFFQKLVYYHPHMLPQKVGHVRERFDSFIIDIYYCSRLPLSEIG